MHKYLKIYSLSLALICSLAFTGLVLLAPPDALAQERTPLLMEGKKTLFQRIIVHPGAKSYAQPGPDSAEQGKAVKPFSVLYVYGRKDVASAADGQTGQTWLEVSPSTSGQNLVWIPENLTANWKQSLTLLFTDRMGRQPVLFFDTAKNLETVCEKPSVATEVTNLAKQFQEYAKGGQKPATFPVLAMEPPDEQGAVARSRFYIMPIFDWSDPFEGLKLLQVASIDPGAGDNSQAGSGNEVANDDSLKTGIAFVIDTTVSMRPYIDQSLSVARSIYDAVEKAKVNNKVGLAVVAFRSSTDATPGIEYNTKIISEFKQINQRKELEQALSEVKEASISTHAYNEDSYAGIAAAIEKLDWSKYQSRVIMLITDAGPLESGDPYASSSMGSEEIADLARAKGIKIVAVHVKTPSGAKNHNYADSEYNKLTRMPDSGESSYIGINAQSPDAGAKAFGSFASSMSSVFVDLVKRTAEGGNMNKPSAKPKDTPEDKGRWIAENLGYSMQLEYIGEKKGVRAPQVVTSWIADMDLARMSQNRSTPAVEVAVLLSKAQLSALQQQLKIIVDNAERTKRTDSKDFFQSILSASAQMARDPNMFTLKPGQNLQQLGILGEFLDDLPYKSQVLGMTEEDWYNMPVGQQTAFINRLKSRIARYDEYEKDRDNWESFGAANSDDWLYRVPLNMLP